MPELPYIARFTSFKEVRAAWERLCALEGRCESCAPYALPHVRIDPRFQKDYRVIVLRKNEYANVNFLTDCFTEPARLEAKRFDQEHSAAEYWRRHGAALCARNPGATLQELRALLYGATVEVMNFRLTVAVAIYDTFMPRSVFDPCAGHGDRLIAAMSRSYIVSYEACEPNSSSFAGMSNAVKMFGASKKIQLHCVPFENFVLRKKYDLVFTSPPYFDVEVYTLEKTQSIVRYPSIKVWYRRFLRLMFLRCWEHVAEDGHMVVSINNVYDRLKKCLRFDCTEKLVSDITTMCARANFLGVISYGAPNSRMEPMFIWRKEKSPVPAYSFEEMQQRRAETRLKQVARNSELNQ